MIANIRLLFVCIFLFIGDAMTKLLGSCLAIVFLLMQYQLWFVSGGIMGAINLKHDIAQSRQENTVLTASNKDLITNIDHLKYNHQAIETKARNELGMIKSDEVFYRVVTE